MNAPHRSTRTTAHNEFGLIRSTQFPELSYQRQGDGWRFIDNATGRNVGPYYPTMTTLLADLDRYAALFGCK